MELRDLYLERYFGEDEACVAPNRSHPGDLLRGASGGSMRLWLQFRLYEVNGRSPLSTMYGLGDIGDAMDDAR